MKLIADEDEVLIYHVLACLYLVLKVENQLFNVPFVDYWQLCISTPSYSALQSHLAPKIPLCIWDDGLYNKIEQVILHNMLSWKTNYVSPAEAIYQVVCSYAEV